jgi:hypothetical protein
LKNSCLLPRRCLNTLPAWEQESCGRWQEHKLTVMFLPKWPTSKNVDEWQMRWKVKEREE